MTKDHFDTLAVWGEEEGENPRRALNPPIFQTSSFTMEDIDVVEDIMSFNRDDLVYTRGNNPTLNLLERRIALLEGGVAGVSFSSGMGAISSTLLSLLEPGDKLICHKVLYGSSVSFATSILKRYRIEAVFVDATSLDEVASALADGAKVVYLETPANPSLDILDIVAISEMAHRLSAKVVVDNTFATPYFQQPLALGADVVLHSATKYLCGHGDALGGLVTSKDEAFLHRLKFGYMAEFGNVLSPFNAWLILRGIKTLGVRMKRHEENAMAIASFLESHEAVEKVWYPGLTSFPGHQLAKAQMMGYGGMISLVLKGTEEKAKVFIRKLRLFHLAVSLGDCDSLVEMAYVMTHRGYSDDDLAPLGLTTRLVRLSVGIEDVRDLIKDIEQALEEGDETR